MCIYVGMYVYINLAIIPSVSSLFFVFLAPVSHFSPLLCTRNQTKQLGWIDR